MLHSNVLSDFLGMVASSSIGREPTESGKTGPWLADNQSRDLNNELWLAVYLIRSVASSIGRVDGVGRRLNRV